MKEKSTDKWKVYAIVLTSVVCALIVFAIIFLAVSGYGNKLFVKLGLTEQTANEDWTVKSYVNTIQKMDYDVDIVFIGDSITAGNNFNAVFEDKKILTLGFYGADLASIAELADCIPSLKAEKIFVMGGINGLSDNNIDKTLQAYKNLTDKIKDGSPDAEIYIQSVLPISEKNEKTVCKNSTITEFNDKLQQLAQTEGFTFINLYPLYYKDGQMDAALTKDGVHLLETSYTLWAEAIKSYIYSEPKQ